jgi:uncharacterized protein (UPF0548 family)
MSVARQPVWSLTAPSSGQIDRFLSGMAELPFEYPSVGASMNGAPAGFELDHNRVQLGQGATDFAAGCAALKAWKMFPPPWTRLSPADAAINVGTVVAMQAHALGFWWMNGCRIVYVIDEAAGPIRRFGFAYGTLPAHVEAGEERFMVEMRADETVWYDLRAFSRPRYWPVRLAKPIARALQRRFVRDSKAVMVRAVAEARS